TLDRAANLPRGLTPHEVQFFSPETRDLAQQHISVWPVDVHEASTFLTNLPKPGAELTDREIEIVRHLADGHTRAEMAQILDISVNTLKTHLRSIYKKLGVASAKDAISSVQQRGLLYAHNQAEQYYNAATKNSNNDRQLLYMCRNIRADGLT